MKRIALYLILVLMLFTTNCKKEEIVYYLTPTGTHTYTFENLVGNVRIDIYNTAHSYSITIVNGPGSVVGCAIRNYNSPSTIYFNDSYIYKGKTQTQSSATAGIPLGEKLELKLVVYKSTVSSAIFRSIEMLGLDFWDGINNYKESIGAEYITVFVLEG